MRNLKSLILLPIFLFFINCEKDDDSKTISEEFLISVVNAELPEKVNVNQEFEINLELSLSGCWSYSRIEKEELKDEIKFKVYAVIITSPDEMCTTGFYKQEIIEKIKIENLGEKTISFENSKIIKKIIVE